MNNRFWAWLLPLVTAASSWHCGAGADLPPVPTSDGPRQLRGDTHVTFLVAADTHLGYEGMEEANRRQVEAMNGLPGQAWPAIIGGSIAEPRALFVAGDLTDSGQPGQWDEFARIYGWKGGDGMLRYPVLLGTGNHDRPMVSWSKPVLPKVRERHGSLVYAWDWGDLHLVNLDMYPTAATREWLSKDLAVVGRQRPVVLFLHFSLSGPYSEFWSEADRMALLEVIRGHNIVAIFHGHYHASMHYQWHGYDVYNTGAVRHGQNTFLAVRVTPTHFSVASRRWDTQSWKWWHHKPIKGLAAGREEQVPAGVGEGARSGG